MVWTHRRRLTYTLESIFEMSNANLFEEIGAGSLAEVESAALNNDRKRFMSRIHATQAPV